MSNIQINGKTFVPSIPEAEILKRVKAVADQIGRASCRERV